MLRWMTAGESHGPALIATIEGLPSGLRVTTEDLRRGLARRRLGYGRGARQKFEADEVSILAGVRHGVTTGAPVAIRIGNSEWPKWETVMSADPVDPSALLIDAGTGDEREIARNRPLTRPRPGHADLPGMLSYGLPEARPVLERASARETAARVALGVLAEALLEQVAGVHLVSHVVSVGAQRATASSTPTPADEAALCEASMRTLDPGDNARFEAAVDAAKQAGDTIGGVAEVIAYDVPVGLGTHVTARERLDARLAAALMSIQSVKGVEIGDGFAEARRRGSQAHDEIIRTDTGAITRTSNRAGGLEGGMTNGQPLIVRAAMKPISTVPRALKTIDMATGDPASAIHQRSDVCAVPAAGVVAEAMVTLVLARAVLNKFAGDNISETSRNINSYLAKVTERLEFNS